MENGDGKESGIESLPEDMLHLIVSKLTSDSSTDFCNARLSCKSLKFDTSDSVIAAKLNLYPLVINPKKARNYISLIDSCSKAGNLDAHFLKVVIEFFDRKNKYLCLHHLQIASRGNHPEGSYLYGLLLMCFGRLERGQKIINDLVDTQGVHVLQKCLRNTNVGLSGFSHTMKDVYVNSYISMKPDPHCHPEEMNTMCAKCFHFFLMSEFFEMVISLGTLIDF